MCPFEVSVPPFFQNVLDFAPKRRWRRNFPGKVEGERVSGGKKSQRNRGFANAVSHAEFTGTLAWRGSMPSGIEGELSTVAIGSSFPRFV